MLTLLSALSLAAGFLRPVLWTLDGVLILLFLVDFVRAGDPARMSIDRSLPERVGLSRDFTRQLHLEGERTAGLALEVHEEFPAALHVSRRASELDPSGGPEIGSCDASGRVTFERSYVSDVRGVFTFGDVRVALSGPLGLVQRQTRFHARMEVAVEPALMNLRRTLRLAASDRWQDLGVRRLRKRGGETEFESLREYVPGDDVRRVDWKAFAKRGKPMIRQYQVERGQELILLIDAGRRMRITTAKGSAKGWTKLDWALDAALQLAAVALAKGDRVGIATFADGLGAWVAPARGGGQQARLSHVVFGEQPAESDADLGRAVRELALRHRRRATVVVLSDVADPYSVERQRSALAAGSRRHRLVFAALDDPGLRAAFEVGATSATVRAAAFELVADRERALSSLASTGVRVLDALPAEAAAPLLAAWLDERRR